MPKTRRLPARMGRPPVGTAPRQPIAFRIDRDVLAALQALAAARGVPYQTLMHTILEDGVRRLQDATTPA